MNKALQFCYSLQGFAETHPQGEPVSLAQLGAIINQLEDTYELVVGKDVIELTTVPGMMAPEQFVIWMIGALEFGGYTELSAQQWDVIKEHLNLVFHKVTTKEVTKEENTKEQSKPDSGLDYKDLFERLKKDQEERERNTPVIPHWPYVGPNSPYSPWIDSPKPWESPWKSGEIICKVEPSQAYCMSIDSATGYTTGATISNATDVACANAGDVSQEFLDKAIDSITRRVTGSRKSKRTTALPRSSSSDFMNQKIC